MNTQQAYEGIREHAKKGEPALADNGYSCLYRAPGGRKCFIGALIPDDIYHESMESNRAHSLISPNGDTDTEVENLDKLREFFKDVDVHFASRAQKIHDNGSRDNGPDEWIPALDSLAKEFKLNVVQDA